MLPLMAIDGTPLNEHGTKIRMDGQGDAWAQAHRTCRPRSNYLQDLDCVMGITAFGQNTGERLFLEYVPDDWSNRGSSIRQFGVVALFDRKSNESLITNNPHPLSLALYLWLCRTLGERQGVAPRFFYVVGGQTPPWTMVEIDIHTGVQTGLRGVLQDPVDWQTVWNTLGLEQLRSDITAWISGAVVNSR